MPPFLIENRFGGSKPPPYEGGSICKNSAVLVIFWNFYGIITLGSYLLDKLEFVEKIATASCLSIPTTRDII